MNARAGRDGSESSSAAAQALLISGGRGRRYIGRSAEKIGLLRYCGSRHKPKEGQMDQLAKAVLTFSVIWFAITLIAFLIACTITYWIIRLAVRDAIHDARPWWQQEPRFEEREPLPRPNGAVKQESEASPWRP